MWHRAVLVIMLVAFSGADRTTTGTCTGNQKFDKCDNVCCSAMPANSGLRSASSAEFGSGQVHSCCQDSSTACPTGLSCCAVSGGTADNTNSRTCYDNNVQGCCTIQRYVTSSASPTQRVRVATYSTRTHKCCGNAKTFVTSWSGTVKKDQSCAAPAGCLSDSDCTGISDPDASHFKCCRRPKNTEGSETDVNYNTNGRGTCYDSRTDSCCGGSTGIYWETSLTTRSYSAALVYETATQFCCPQAGKRVMNKGTTDRCPCTADSQCTTAYGSGSSSSCCWSDSTKLTVWNLMECKSECNSNSGGSGGACYGYCTRPEYKDKAGITLYKADKCWKGDGKCGSTVNRNNMVWNGIVLKDNVGCCKAGNVLDPAQVWNTQAYDMTSEVCCPAGTWGSGSSPNSNVVLGLTAKKSFSSRCACNADSDCPTDWTCCGGQSGNTTHVTGKCILTKSEKCCERTVKNCPVYEIYNPDNQVCCPLDGVVTAKYTSKTDKPGYRAYHECSCAGDGDCPTDGVCCVDAQCKDAKAWLMKKKACNADDQSNCPGRCAYSKLETCCDNPFMEEGPTGVQRCSTEHSKCCDGQCCSKRTQTCKKGKVKHGGNWEGYRLANDHEQSWCTTKEHAAPWTVFYAYVFPVLLLLIFLALFILSVLGFVKTLKQGGAMPAKLVALVLAILIFILCALLLFSPVWKYAVTVLIGDIIGLMNQKRKAVMLAWLALFFLIDPLETNILHGSIGHISSQTGQTKTPGTAWGGADPGAYGTYGILSAVHTMHDHSKGGYAKFMACTDHYKFFEYDDNLRDPREKGSAGNMSVDTFGLCAAGWLTTVGVVAGLLILFQVGFVIVISWLGVRKQIGPDGKVIADGGGGGDLINGDNAESNGVFVYVS